MPQESLSHNYITIYWGYWRQEKIENQNNSRHSSWFSEVQWNRYHLQGCWVFMQVLDWVESDVVGCVCTLPIPTFLYYHVTTIWWRLEDGWQEILRILKWWEQIDFNFGTSKSVKFANPLQGSVEKKQDLEKHEDLRLSHGESWKQDTKIHGKIYQLQCLQTTLFVHSYHTLSMSFHPAPI